MIIETSPQFKQLGCIKILTDVPYYKETITHGVKSLVRVPNHEQLSIFAATDDSNNFFIISLDGSQATPTWFHIISQGNRMGLNFIGYYICDPVVLSQLLESISNPEVNEQRNSDARDKNIYDKIIIESQKIDWIKNLIGECQNLGASDMHIEARGNVTTLRIRRDGIIRIVGQYITELVTQSLAALYTMLAEERSRSEVAFNVFSAQSALIPIKIKDSHIALRYQSHPTVGGYDVVLRILKNGSGEVRHTPSLIELGYTEDQVEYLSKALASSTGGIFIAGITGSGKTTTLNSMMTSLASEGIRKIVSIEDPVEYEVDGVTHLSIQRSNDPMLNPFASAMLAFLRMDPDVGMFGEIRDNISGHMAYTAIQTGHKLLTTVHATSGLGIISRLTSPQIALPRKDICTHEFTSALVYQALVPLNCPHCKILATSAMSAQALEPYHQLFKLDISKIYCASSNGCPYCCPPSLVLSAKGHNGIRGMKVSAEVIEPNAELFDLLQHGEDIKARRYWRDMQKYSFDDPCMKGKPAWAHTVYDMSRGLIDPYYFEHLYGDPSLLIYQ